MQLCMPVEMLIITNIIFVLSATIQIYLHQETNVQYIPNYYIFMPSCRNIYGLISRTWAHRGRDRMVV